AAHRPLFGLGGASASGGLRGAPRDHDARRRPLALEPADGLTRLPHRLGGHRAGVEDDGLGKIRGARLATDHLGLIGVEPAAEGDDVDAHRRATARGEQTRGTTHIGTSPFTPLPTYAAPCLAKSAGANLPSYSNSTGPVISTWSSRSRQRMRRSPPGSVSVTTRPVRSRRAAATAAAQAADPHARVRPAPRSRVRNTMCSRDAPCANEIFARSGKIGSCSNGGPSFAKS